MIQLFMHFHYKDTPIQIAKLREALNNNQIDDKCQNIFDVCNIENSKENEKKVFKNILLASSPIRHKDLLLPEIALNKSDKYSWLILEIPKNHIEELYNYPYDIVAEINDSLVKIIGVESTYIAIIKDIIQVGYYFPNAPVNTKKSTKFTLFKAIKEAIGYKALQAFNIDCNISYYKKKFHNPYKYNYFTFYGNYFELRSFKTLYTNIADLKRPYHLKKGKKVSIYDIAGKRHLDESAYKWVVYMLQSEAGKKTGLNKSITELQEMSKMGNMAHRDISLLKIEEAIIDIILYPKKKVSFTAYSIHKCSVFLADDHNNKEENVKQYTPISIQTASKYLKQNPYLIYMQYIKISKIVWKPYSLDAVLKIPLQIY